MHQLLFLESMRETARHAETMAQSAAPVRAALGNLLRQSASAGDVLHHEEGNAVVHFHAVSEHEIGMRCQRDGVHGFCHELLAQIRIGQMLRQRALQCGERISTTIRFRPVAAAEVHQTKTTMENFEHLIIPSNAGSGLKRHLFQKAALTLKLLQ